MARGADTDDGTGPLEESPASADPATDSRADYDYAGGEVTDPGFVTDLAERIDGEVKFDEYTRQLYATDASAYEVTPVGVVYPRSTADVATVVEYCADADLAVLPRGAGTSLAGQAVNEAVVLDFSRHMDAVLAVDVEARTATAQPGILLGDLNDRLASDGLKFAPDPAWGDKSTLGGAIGNNSTGSHSLQYGKTDAYLESCEVVLADGTVTRIEEMSIADLEAAATTESNRLEASAYAALADVLQERNRVRAAYPDIHRNVSGYNLRQFVTAGEDDTVNPARVLAGSEGTLAIVTEATVSLEPIPPTKGVALLRYESLQAAMADVTAVLAHDPAAVEVLDDVLLSLARKTEQFGPLVRNIVPESTEAILLVEFYASDERDAKQLVADLLADRVPEAVATAVPSAGAREHSGEPVRAASAAEAFDPADRERFWTLRKSGLPILLSRTTDAKHVSFVEDVAVPPGVLPEFVADFQEILATHDTHASFYGHAGPGCLHVRPLIDTKSNEDVESMAAIATAVSDLTVEYGGSVSGEHGDGRARTQWSRKQYGDDVWELFRDLKTAFDPDWLLNPGQVCGYAPDEAVPPDSPDRSRMVQLTENLRMGPDDDLDLGFEPALRWENDSGMAGMVELCHGCGGCRGPQETTGGVMCPTYRVSQEEITSTRGRANALRQAMTGDLPADPTSVEFMTEVMDLCVGCKGCTHDCPSEVDMTKLKAELAHQSHQQSGSSFRDRLFAHVDGVSSLGSTIAPLGRYLDALPGSGIAREKLFGIARERNLPPFRRESFADWLESREPRVSPGEARRKALVVPDTSTNYSYPEVGRAAVRVLEAAGVLVHLAPVDSASGRAAYSMGFLNLARERVETNVDTLAPFVADGWDLVTVEPSDAVMFQADYREFVDNNTVRQVAGSTYGICEYLDRFGLVAALTFDATGTNAGKDLCYHGHCHQKATNRDHHAVAVLRRAGFTVDVLDSTCCGMAGSFGYQAEHYAMSRAIGERLVGQVADSDGSTVVTPGASCRTQLADFADQYAGDRPPHPIELLAAALAEGTYGSTETDSEKDIREA